MNERGSGSVLAIAAIAVVTVVGLAVLAVAQIAIARTQAIAAADAAALAAAAATFPPPAGAQGVGGQTALGQARALAEANGATLVSCLCPQLATFEARQVEVTVAVPVDLPMLGRRWVQASSAAEFIP